MSRCLSIATYNVDTSLMVLLSSASSSNLMEFDLILRDVANAVNILTGSVVAISNVKSFVDRRMAMI